MSNQSVDSITCINSGGFYMRFRVIWGLGEGEQSSWTGDYPNPQHRTVDLNGLSIPEGASVWPEVHAVALGGETLQCSSLVIYEADCSNTATYQITGADKDVHCYLMEDQA